MMAWIKQTFFGASAKETTAKKDKLENKPLIDKNVSDEKMAPSDFGQESNTARQIGKR